MWRCGITLNYASNRSKIEVSLCRLTAIFDSEPLMVQDGRQKNAKKNFSLPDTRNYKKNHCGKNGVENHTILHRVYYNLKRLEN